MLSKLENLPDHVVGIEATGEVTKQDFDKVLIPAIDELSNRTGTINYILVLNTAVKNFTAGAWWKDVVVGLKNFTNWNRIAIVTDEKGVEKFSDIFGYFVPGDSKGFKLSELEEAKKWVAAG
jgi:hypothetical protein